MAGHPLDDTDREYRRILGARIDKALTLAEVSKAELAELLDENIANVYQYIKGMRHVPAGVLDLIARVTGVSAEELLADEKAPLTIEGPGGRCPAGFVVEKKAGRMRAAVLLICDKRRHGDEVDHHDPQGLDWRSAPGV